MSGWEFGKSKEMKTKYLASSLALALGLLLLLLKLLAAPPPLRSADGVHYVAPGSDCGEMTPCYADIQAAVDAAALGAEIRVAEGTYTGVSVRDSVTQVVYLSKTLTLRGGYTTGDWTHSYPLTQPTILDAQGRGRVLYITGDINPIIEGFGITGGDATSLGGGPWGESAGSGVYVIYATATITHNWIFSNTSNYGYGGGLYLSHSSAVLNGNIIVTNVAPFDGGGIYLWYSNAELVGNSIVSNTARYGSGGGLCLWHSDALLTRNNVADNIAKWSGGGLYLRYSDALLADNTVVANAAGDDGGGLEMIYSNATLDSNTVARNAAGDDGGGLFIELESDAVLINNVVIENQAQRLGNGIYIGNSSPRLLHNTIVYNIGDSNVGVYITGTEPHYSTVALTNTILVNHCVGITVTTGNKAVLNGVLWYSNTTANTGGAGSITVTGEYTGTPSFMNDGYHLTAASIAINRGVQTGISDDIDGEPRPNNDDFDLGADEFYPDPRLTVTKQVTPNLIEIGTQLTYTIRVTNTGNVTLTAIVTDILPLEVMPTGVFTWAPNLLLPGDVWSEQVVVTVTVSHGTPLVNVVKVTTEEEAMGVYTHTLEPKLEIFKRASFNFLETGTQLTYTIWITNTGDFLLHAIVTDTLPAHVAPTGVLTWTPVITAPGGVWMGTVVVTVETGYTGLLTNTVKVTSEEGATGTASVTVRAILYRVYLPLVSRPPDPCRPIPGASYSSLFVVNPTNPDAENDPGFNIGLLGWELTAAYKGVVDYGMGDTKAPKFYYLFADLRAPDFSNVYRLYNGDGTLNTDWPVTVAGLAVTTDEIIHTPDSGYDIQYGYDAMVIYASRERIALNYTRGDNLLGYTVYVDGICVEPSLLALYEQLDAADRYDLPVVRGGQAIGRAWNTEIRVAVRDTGTVLDPRGLDWWRRP